ncbi:MAG: hypothetical protein ABSD44_12340 [Terracidiphilus sp.]
MARTRQAVAGGPRGTGAQQKTVSRGSAKLKAAADKKLEENSEAIAKSLYENLIRGNATSAKLLFALAEGQIDCEDEAMVQHFYSLAEELGKEPEWKGDLSEEEAESCAGVVETAGGWA